MNFEPTNIPIENEYPKLVRDNIPEIIKSKNKVAGTRVLESEEEYLKFLLKKIIEEAHELEHSVEAGNIQEELADVLELIHTIIKLKKWTVEDIVNVQKDKRKKNGGFEKRLLMLNKPQ